MLMADVYQGRLRPSSWRQYLAGWTPAHNQPFGGNGGAVQGMVPAQQPMMPAPVPVPQQGNCAGGCAVPAQPRPLAADCGTGIVCPLDARLPCAPALGPEGMYAAFVLAQGYALASALMAGNVVHFVITLAPFQQLAVPLNPQRLVRVVDFSIDRLTADLVLVSQINVGGNSHNLTDGTGGPGSEWSNETAPRDRRQLRLATFGNGSVLQITLENLTGITLTVRGTFNVRDAPPVQAAA